MPVTIVTAIIGVNDCDFISRNSVTINSSVTSKNSQKTEPTGSYSEIDSTNVPASDGERWVWFTVNASNGNSRKFKMKINVT